MEKLLGLRTNSRCKGPNGSFPGRGFGFLPVLLADRSNVEPGEKYWELVSWFAMKAIETVLRSAEDFVPTPLSDAWDVPDVPQFFSLFRQYLIGDYYLESSKDTYTDLDFWIGWNC